MSSSSFCSTESLPRTIWSKIRNTIGRNVNRHISRMMRLERDLMAI
jgi:hypothetical protein